MDKNTIKNILNKIKPFCPGGAAAGIIFFCSMFFLSLIWNAGFSVMGVEKSEVTKLVLSSFWPYVVFAQIKILFVYIFLGFIIGWIAEFTARNFIFSFKGFRFLWIFIFNTYFLVKSIKKYPQLYTEALYFHSTAGKKIQVFITDVMPLWSLKIFEIFLIVTILFAAAAWLKKIFGTKIYIAALAAVMIAGVIFKRVYYHYFLPAKNKGVNIVVIAADSLRKDRISKELTPNIYKLAEEGVVFNNEYTSFPRTFPAMISLLSGKLPVTHGVRHMFPDQWHRNHEEGSLPQLLGKNGYTSAVVSDFAGDVFSRMKIGFDKIRVPYFNFVTLIDQRSLEIHYLLMPYITNLTGRKIFPELKEFANNADPFMLADETNSTLNELSQKGKFFCTVFFSNLHFPYASPYPYYLKHTLPGYNGRYKYHKPPTLYDKENIKQEDIEQIHGLYDGSLEAFDASVGKIISFLKQKKCYDNTIIIITADHGENLYESNWTIGHGEHLRGNNVIKVPLIIRFPGNQFSKQTVDCVTRDIDVTPTLLDYLKLKLPENIDGKSLMPLIEGKTRDMNLTAFAETGIWFSDISEGFYQQQRIMYPDITGISKIDFTYNMEVVLKPEYENIVNTAKHRMIDDGKYRLIYIPVRDGVKYELYDLKEDPNFINDIAAKNLNKVNEMKKQLFGLMAKDKLITFKKDFAVPEGYNK